MKRRMAKWSEKIHTNIISFINLIAQSDDTDNANHTDNNRKEGMILVTSNDPITFLKSHIVYTKLFCLCWILCFEALGLIIYFIYSLQSFVHNNTQCRELLIVDINGTEFKIIPEIVLSYFPSKKLFSLTATLLHDDGRMPMELMKISLSNIFTLVLWHIFQGY